MIPETEDKIMSAAMIVLMLGAAMTFLGLGLLAIGIAIAEFRSVGKADSGSAACVSPVEGNRSVAAGLDGARRSEGVTGQSKAALGRFVGNPCVNDREGDMADVRHEDRPCADAVVEPLLHGRLRDVPKLLPADGTPGEICGDGGDGCRAEGAKRRKRGAERHDPLGGRVFHGGDYSANRTK